MLTTRDEGLARRLRLLRAHGMTATSWDRERGHATGYDVVERGHNYRPSELEAALGLAQLAKLPEATARRRALVGAYRDALAGRPELGLVPFTPADDATSACHIMPLVTPGPEAREAARAALAAARVQSSVHYPPAHRFSIFAPQPALMATEDYARREVTLPLFAQMDRADVARVVDALPRVSQAAGRAA